MATGSLFDVIHQSTEIPSDPQAEAIIALAKTMHAMGLTPSYGPGDHGNLSCRISRGILISARETSKVDLQPAQLVHVLGKEDALRGPRVICRGPALPSTDTLMHLAIYEQRPDIGAIVHGHDNQLLRRAEALKLSITHTSAKTNSFELIDEMRALSVTHDFMILRDHGFVALGPTLDAAWELCRRWLDQAKRYSKRAA